MPTEQELQNEVSKLKKERDSKQRMYQFAQDAANGSANSLKEAQIKYQKSLDSAKKQGEKAVNEIAKIAESDAPEEKKYIDFERLKKQAQDEQRKLSEDFNDLSSYNEANKKLQTDAEKAKKDLQKAQSSLDQKEAELTAKQEAQKRVAAAAELQAKSQEASTSADQIEQKIAEYNKSGTGLNEFDPDKDCANIESKCNECSMAKYNAINACKEYSMAKETYEKSKLNTIKTAKEEEENQSKAQTDLLETENIANQLINSVSAGMSLLKEMSKTGATETKKDRLRDNIEQNQKTLTGLQSIMGALKFKIKTSGQKTEKAKEDEQKAKQNVSDKKGSAKVALASLKACNIRCEANASKVNVGSTDANKEKSGLGSVEGGSSGPIGATGDAGLETSEMSGMSGIPDVGTWYWVNDDGTSGLAFYDATSKASYEASNPTHRNLVNVSQVEPQSSVDVQKIVETPISAPTPVTPVAPTPTVAAQGLSPILSNLTGGSSLWSSFNDNLPAGTIRLPPIRRRRASFSSSSSTSSSGGSSTMSDVSLS